MGVFTLAKGIITLSTAGGSLLGGYFASNLSTEKENVELVSPELPPQQDQESSIKNDSDESLKGEKEQPSVDESRELGESEDRNKDEGDRSSGDISDEENSQITEPEIDNNNVTFDSPWLNQALEGTEKYVPLKEEENDKEREDDGEIFEEFYNDDEFAGEEDEELEPKDPRVAYYIKTGSEDSMEQRKGPICQSWVRGNGIHHSVQSLSDKDCQDSIKGKSWGQESSIPLLVWIDVDQGQTKRVLEHYKLWDNTSSFKNNQKRKYWTTGNWMCRRERSSDNKRFLIDCDYHNNLRS
ncbi:ICP22 family protein [Mycoplasma suis]|uniref:Uncharacterized protein n=1 Tax=Mycoplasma suis (strain Illinois) TaxID=768700 RepID=F0QQL2_MYCSL|nr:hypothetical protein [Mycoplasma suis]ADX97782.1 hypothetical protein MSU_0238 [Mycoplasma suis str. Illinois]